MKRARAVHVMAAGIVLALAACSLVRNPDCVSTPESIAAISDGLVPGATLGDGYAVSIDIFQGPEYVVAARIEGPVAGAGQIGIWAIATLGGDPIHAVNAVARQQFGEATFEGPQRDPILAEIANSAEAATAVECVEG